MTSGPMPSPGIAAITCSRMSRLPVQTLSQDISPKEVVPQKRGFGSEPHLYEICSVASRAAPRRPGFFNALCLISSEFLVDGSLNRFFRYTLHRLFRIVKTRNDAGYVRRSLSFNESRQNAS